MTDMKPIAEQSDLDRAKARVETLEAKHAEAKAAHYAAFPSGKTSDAQRASWSALDAIKSDLDRAKWRLDHVTKSAEVKRTFEARIASASLPKTRIFEVKAPDGRVFRHRAHSAAQLTGELEYGYASPKFLAPR